jgi:hypothetical protein
MNPQLGAALQNPQIRSMLSNPNILRQMADPAVLQVPTCTYKYFHSDRLADTYLFRCVCCMRERVYVFVLCRVDCIYAAVFPSIHVFDEYL